MTSNCPNYADFDLCLKNYEKCSTQMCKCCAFECKVKANNCQDFKLSELKLVPVPKEVKEKYKIHVYKPIL